MDLQNNSKSTDKYSKLFHGKRFLIIVSDYGYVRKIYRAFKNYPKIFSFSCSERDLAFKDDELSCLKHLQKI